MDTSTHRSNKKAGNVANVSPPCHFVAPVHQSAAQNVSIEPRTTRAYAQDTAPTAACRCRCHSPVVQLTAEMNNNNDIDDVYECLSQSLRSEMSSLHTRPSIEPDLAQNRDPPVNRNGMHEITHTGLLQIHSLDVLSRPHM